MLGSSLAPKDFLQLFSCVATRSLRSANLCQTPAILKQGEEEEGKVTGNNTPPELLQDWYCRFSSRVALTSATEMSPWHWLDSTN